jgi:hypothetical protein
MTKMKKVLIAFAVIAVIAFCGYYYVMHGGARDLASENTDFTVTSKSITNEFVTNMDLSNKKYLEKAVAINGTITSISGLDVIIDNTVICSLKEADSSIKKDDKVTIKGRVVGFDDLMGELKLDQCFILKN